MNHRHQLLLCAFTSHDGFRIWKIGGTERIDHSMVVFSVTSFFLAMKAELLFENSVYRISFRKVLGGKQQLL